MRQIRNFVTRLSVHYILISILLLLRGISRDQQLFGVWIVAFVFTVLTVTVRRILLSVLLPLVIMTGGLFVFIIDGLVLVLTATLTRLNINNFGWALLGVILMSTANIWIERALRLLGWIRDADLGEQNIMTREAPPWWLRVVLLVLLLFGVGYAFAMATQLFLAVSHLTTNVVTMVVVGTVAFALLVAGISWLVAEGLVLDRRARFSSLVTAITVLTIAVPAAVAVLVAPAPPPAPLPEPQKPTQYWDLPTGSRIAYLHYPAVESSAGRNPIFFLHDLGRAVLRTDLDFFSQFTAQGYDVYLYDQIGCGLSARLDSIEAYSILRHVLDLEAIREMIRADRLILIAHAGGSEIAARYMVEHRDRVERVVFYSPTPLWNDEEFVFDETSTAASPGRELAAGAIRPLVATALAVQRPAAAQRYLSQAELAAWANAVIDEGTMVCASQTDVAPDPENPGYNPYAEIVGEVTANRGTDPRPALRQLLIPTVLLRGECDPVDRAVVDQYQQAIPYLQVYHLEDAGSMLHLSRPEAVKELIVAFLRKGRDGES